MCDIILVDAVMMPAMRGFEVRGTVPGPSFETGGCGWLKCVIIAWDWKV